ncbi:uncharacterized protein LOC144584007 [Pogona vitticeps]
MGDSDGSPPRRWGSRKLWVAVSLVELAIILILAAGLAHLATHREGEPGPPERWPPDGSALPALGEGGRWTLQAATRQWRLCWNHTKILEANASALSTEAIQLGNRLRQKEFDIKALEGELFILKNWTKKLEELNIQQREIITHFHQQQKLWSDSGHLHHCGVAWLVASVVTMALLL